MKCQFFETIREARRIDKIYFRVDFTRYDYRGYLINYGDSSKYLYFGFDEEPYALAVNEGEEVDYERRIECAKLAVEWAKRELSEWMIDYDEPEVQCTIECRIYQPDNDEWIFKDFYLKKTEDGVEEGWCF